MDTLLAWFMFAGCALAAAVVIFLLGRHGHRRRKAHKHAANHPKNHAPHHPGRR